MTFAEFEKALELIAEKKVNFSMRRLYGCFSSWSISE